RCAGKAQEVALGRRGAARVRAHDLERRQGHRDARGTTQEGSTGQSEARAHLHSPPSAAASSRRKRNASSETNRTTICAKSKSPSGATSRATVSTNAR